MSYIHIKNGRIIDPANSVDGIHDLYIENGYICAIDQAPEGFSSEHTIDAAGLWVCPGVIDLSARLREPGQEHKATIDSETQAAASSGITTLCIPPDTQPVIDEPAVVELIHQHADDASYSKVITLGALTQGLAGQQLSEMAALKAAGCIGVSNAKQPMNNLLVMRRAMEYANTHDLTVYVEANDPALNANGCAHEGALATRLGLSSIPVAAETTAIASLLELIAETNCRVHFCRLSSARSVELIEQGKKRGLAITADVAAHHLWLTDMELGTYNSHCHVLPPLRDQRDRDALIQGVAYGIIDCICSDHQPHERDAKQQPFPATEPGISALETLLPLTLKLVENKQLSLERAIQALTCNPAQITGIHAGHLSIGTPADICIIDPDCDWMLTTEHMESEGKNSPFLGWSFQNQVTHTLVDGELIFARHSTVN